MKNIFSLVSIFAIMLMALSACDSNSEGTSGNRNKSDNSDTKISGTIKNAYGMNAVFQELHLNQPDIKTLDSVSFSPDGAFSLVVPGGVKQGFYGIKLGQGYFIIVSDGTEKNITIDGDLQTLGKYQYTINGSDDSWLGKGFFFCRKHDCVHQLNYIRWRKMLPGCFVTLFI